MILALINDFFFIQNYISLFANYQQSKMDPADDHPKWNPTKKKLLLENDDKTTNTERM